VPIRFVPHGRYRPRTPDDILFGRQFSIRLTVGQTRSVAAIASQEQTNPSAIIRRLLADGLRLHQRVEQLRDRVIADAP
jgi:hypothetical protein